MSTYALSGSGTHALTATTTALHVTLTALNPEGGVGNADPANHYHQALLRFGDGTGYWASIPVEGGPQWIGVPPGATSFGYACINGATLSVEEVLGGTSPFQGPAGSTGPAGPTGPAGSGAMAYHEVQLGADVSLTPAATWIDVLSQSCAAGTWLIIAEIEAYDPTTPGSHGIFCRLTDGSTVYVLRVTTEVGSAAVADTVLFATVVLGTTTTVKLQCQSGSGTTTKVGASNLGAPFSAADTRLLCLQIA